MNDESNGPLLEVRRLTQEFRTGRRRRDEKGRRVAGIVHAVSDVSFDVCPGETVGIAGETGSGKSTLARAILQAPRPRSGQVLFDGQDLTALNGGALRTARRGVQMVFQDPYTSLDPHWRVRDLIEEPLVVQGIGSKESRQRRVTDLLNLVGLSQDRHGGRRPKELSGGQCQRVAIARALAPSPRLVICDEAVSSLDVSIQAQILNLFESLRAELRLSYLFIAHDLAVVKHVSDRVGIMYLGRLCEIGPTSGVYDTPAHPYTAALLASIPEAERDAVPGKRTHLGGEPPSPIAPPSGCRFRTRCQKAHPLCAEETPELREVAPGHSVACHFPLAPWESVGVENAKDRKEGLI